MDRDFTGKLVELSWQEIVFSKGDKDLIVGPKVDEIGALEVEEGNIVV